MQVNHWKWHERHIITIMWTELQLVLLTQVSHWNQALKAIFTHESFCFSLLVSLSFLLSPFFLFPSFFTMSHQFADKKCFVLFVQVMADAGF